VTLAYTTIVTPIVPDRRDKLERCLRNDVLPLFNRATIIKCQKLFPFDQIKSLHFCSLLILDGKEEADSACLVFEATFDGPREEFFHDLLSVAPDGIHAIYENCVGYPQSGLAVPALIKDYLVSNDVGAQTFFSGSPGRIVAQIRGEKEIRDEIVSFVCQRRLQGDAPTTLLDLQRELQQKVIRDPPANRWAEQPAVVPWELARRGLVAGTTGLGLLLAACGLGAFILLLFGLGPAGVVRMVLSLMSSAEDFGRWLTSFEGLRQIVLVGRAIDLPIPLPLISLIVAWLVLRSVEFYFETEDPRAASFLGRAIVYLSFILRYALVVFLAGFAVLWLDPKLLQAPAQSAPAPTLWLLFLAAVIWLLLFHWATSLKLANQFQELTKLKESVRRLLLDLAHFAMVIVVVWAFLILVSHVPSIAQRLTFVFTLTKVLLMLATYILIGVIAVYLVVLGLLVLVRIIELRDSRRYAPASDLITKGTNDASAYRREDGGVNKYQNHLASLTYVKPGFLRASLLRATLFAIGLLSRFWFNRGDLGGIPTILAARWALIDGGRRLLFLTNYGGGWESYLDEFIDMGAVTGLNAIWTNTFVKTANRMRQYAFPPTKFYIWRGAEAEQPFKAYVRQSQIETIVWYSAYPTLSVINLNTNTDLRQALFKQLAPYELDSVFLRAGL
jgi:hypothetical protein